ncbi:relaxase/mobilization nuclease domain-containing protein [Pedobacter sp. UYP1]|uniref:relaxase/mobilization nuclease domain-containing protein n=1 Tax=Pedobacter sp. UYP1 TaxID=1756396 RepID=UPI00339710D9
MMGKIPKAGKSFKGCVEYCVLKNDAEILDANGVRIDQVAHITSDFNMQRKMRPSLGQAVGHIALNWSPEDAPKLTDELMVNIAKEYLQKMNITDTQVLMIRHHDTKHPHLHLIYNRVDNQGKPISDAYQRWKNVKASKALTLKYSFHMGEGKAKVNRPQLKGADKVKYELHDKIKAILPKVISMDELQKQLGKQGIGMMYKYKSGTAEVQGVSFTKGKYQFKGSEIDRSLSYGKMSKVIADRMQAQQGQSQKEKKEQPKSLADQLREVIESTYLKSEPETHYLREQPEINYLQSESQANYMNKILPDPFLPEIHISDDVDDEAIHGRNRQRKGQAHTNRR